MKHQKHDRQHHAEADDDRCGFLLLIHKIDVAGRLSPLSFAGPALDEATENRATTSFTTCRDDRTPSKVGCLECSQWFPNTFPNPPQAIPCSSSASRIPRRWEARPSQHVSNSFRSGVINEMSQRRR